MVDSNEFAQDLIAELRGQVDEIDERIIELVQLRTEISKKIMKVKREKKMPMITGTREKDIFGRYAKALGDLGKTMAGALLCRSRGPIESDLKKEES